ncbi:MAG: hypothetical protein Q4D51_07945 [Eubacteriales bacterium]|nr:hypothetical protein [Eubacteriales bacterium]
MTKEEQVNQRYIYIMLSRTHTIPARLIRLFTGATYSHTSLALDVELKEMYSFARRRVHNPFNAGFVDEDIETGIFGRDKNVYCSVYALAVTEEQYKVLCEELKHFIRHRELYDYNYKGLVGVLFGKNVARDYNYFCSQFVSYILSRSGIELFEKEHGLVQPCDFHLQLEKQRIYEGKLTEYRKFVETMQMHIEQSDSLIAATTSV